MLEREFTVLLQMIESSIAGSSVRPCRCELRAAWSAPRIGFPFHNGTVRIVKRKIPLADFLGRCAGIMANESSAETVARLIGVRAVYDISIKEQHVTGIQNDRNGLQSTGN